MNYRTVTDRIADACLRAARLRVFHFIEKDLLGLPPAADERVNLLLIYARSLMRQLGRQGLTPDDLDHATGHAAVEAVALALNVQTSTQLMGPDGRLIPRPLRAHNVQVPRAWLHVANAATRLSASFQI